MKVLLTGATGFVGSHVADVLHERGHVVHYIARATSNMRWLDGKPFKRVEGSLFDLHSLQEAVTDVDAVIHVAGLTAARNEEEYRRGNRDATQNLIDAVRLYRPGLQRFVHISSMAAAGPAASLEHPRLEDEDCHPITAYGRTKLEAEVVVRDVMQEIPCTIIRPPAVYGERDEAVLTFFQTIRSGIMPLIGFDDKHVSLVHIHDLARGIVDALEAPVAEGQTYYISSDEFYTWRQISQLTGRIMGKKFQVPIRIPHTAVMSIAGVVGFFGNMTKKPPVLNYEKGLDIIQGYWICSTAKARRELGYRQQVSLEDGLARSVSWYRKQGWL